MFLCKKLLLASILAFAGTGAMAQSAFEGFYGQVGVGYESIDSGFSNGTMITGGAAGQAFNISSSSSKSLTGNVGLGAYFPVTSTFLLGVGADYSPIAGSSTNFTFRIPTAGFAETNSWKKTSSQTVFVSPAYVVAKDKLAYAKVGYAGLSTQKTNTNGTRDATDYTGYSLGFGYKQMFSGSIYAFGEVNYAAYGSKSLGSDNNGSSKPTAMNALVGVGYKF